MAVFKTLKAKKKEYPLEYGGNAGSADPARAVFARFPLPGETFLRRGADLSYRDIDFAKVGEKDNAELEKLFSVFITGYMDEMMNSAAGDKLFARVDGPAFLRECVDHFESLEAEDETGGRRAVASVDDFLALPGEAVYGITRELYGYARTQDQFTLGE
jgi:hypothetical protein